jgi:murein DD-endopeptidase MepM/ murein hydrolase activator NlpD
MFIHRSFASDFLLAVAICVFLFLFITPQKSLALTWAYPLDRTLERASYKTFGQLIDKQFYVGKESLFPNRFYGYHAGSDLEIFPEELNKDVLVSAISSGIIIFVGRVSGYGGLILEKIDNEDLTVLYGHLKLENSWLKVGDRVDTGAQVALLGDAFSGETGGERKHLHFAIYEGHGLYFRGYEDNKNALDESWLDPITFLRENIVATPSVETQASAPLLLKDEEQRGFLDLIVGFFLGILRRY